ncbi:Hypothetical protein CpOVIZ01_2155 [Corynebacterium pseudotuberculosis]|nr:Hypothetical protein CpOVIZ01_2155 [Corynebacterium pseudotuberculosis]
MLFRKMPVIFTNIFKKMSFSGGELMVSLGERPAGVLRIT